MSNMRAIRAAVVCLVGWALVGSCFAARHKPNIVLLYIDDWAWNGTPVAMDDAMANSRMPILQMPKIERVAREGMRFRNAYASPQCSPVARRPAGGMAPPCN
jgi:hypothetical protein